MNNKLLFLVIVIGVETYIGHKHVKWESNALDSWFIALIKWIKYDFVAEYTDNIGYGYIPTPDAIYKNKQWWCYLKWFCTYFIIIVLYLTFVSIILSISYWHISCKLSGNLCVIPKQLINNL
jgi:hypothetical protein